MLATSSLLRDAVSRNKLEHSRAGHWMPSDLSLHLHTFTN